MAENLLHKTAKAYLLYALAILLVSAPVFYYATKSIYLKEADDALRMHKQTFLRRDAPLLTVADIPAWNRFNRNVSINSGSTLSKDSLFFSTYYDSVDEEEEPYRELNVPIMVEGKPFTYVEKINLVETADLLMNIAILFTIVMILLLSGLFIITRTLNRRLWKPFYQTLALIEHFEIDKGVMPQPPATGIAEFNRLNESIRKLVAKNIGIYSRQREFIENAAHELQTPLAVFQAKIDTLMQGAGVTMEQAAILDALNENVYRLNRLNKNLLMLSKIHPDQYPMQHRFDVVACVNKNLDFFKEQALAKNLSIATHITGHPMPMANAVLAEVLISNLFMNAIRHNVSGGTISISIDDNALSFANTGQPKALSQDKLFNRFSKNNSSETGTGLGLSIVKKISDQQGWVITYEFSTNQHTFHVRFA